MMNTKIIAVIVVLAAAGVAVSASADYR